MIQVKICGITRVQDAHLTVELGAAALGFIFYPLSPRYVTPEQVITITEHIDNRIKKVGVFVNETPTKINSIVQNASLDLVQLSGEEPPEIIPEIAAPVIKAFHVESTFNPSIARSYPIHAILLDTHHPSLYGGTGNIFDWELIRHKALSLPLVLSGGLTPDNILTGIKTIKPHAVDVNSGVEALPGVKDPVKMKHLFTTLQNTKARDEQVF